MQASLHRSHPFRRLEARRRWAAVRRLVPRSPRRHAAAAAAASTMRSTWRAVLASPRAELAPLVPWAWLASTAPWLANTALLIGALLPPVSLMGFVCLAALVLRLSIQLSVAHPAVRARSAAWVWILFGALMLLALAARYGLRIPWVTTQLVRGGAQGGAIETHCRTVASRSGAAAPDASCVDEFLQVIYNIGVDPRPNAGGLTLPWRGGLTLRLPLPLTPMQDVGLGGGFAGYGHLPVELLANALLVALAARGYRSCAAFHAHSRASAAAATAATTTAFTTAFSGDKPSDAASATTGGDKPSDAASAAAASAAAATAVPAMRPVVVAAEAWDSGRGLLAVAVVATPRDAVHEDAKRQACS